MPDSAVQQPRLSSTICRMLAGGIVVAMVCWFLLNYRGHDVVPENAPPNQVSGVRALKVLEQLLGDQSPHPAGSPNNNAVRARLIEQLEQLGIEVTEFPFQAEGVSMTNVLATVPGDSQLRPILLATHYDSVEAGPGAGDAGSCVGALLETARWFLHQRDSSQLPENLPTVYFLFTDGEEWVRGIGHGLNGADNFVQTNTDILQQRSFILNFDARGSSGPSLLYETSRNNLRLMQALLPELPRPAFTASSYVAVYDLLPNATDFTEFKAAGSEGLNFAFIGEPHRYHTPEDTLKNLDPASVQHHANNAAAFLKAWVKAPLDDVDSNQNAVFFEIFGNWIVCYPESVAVWLALSILGMQLVGLFKALRRGMKFSSLFDSTAALFVGGIGCLLTGWIVLQLKDQVPRSGHGFGEHDWLLVVGMWLSCLVFVGCAFRFLGGRANDRSTWHVVWLMNAVFGLASATLLPGFSYIFFACGIVPAALSLIALDQHASSVIAVAAASVICVPLGYQFGIALGVRMALPLSVLFFLFLGPLYPLMAQRSGSFVTQQKSAP